MTNEDHVAHLEASLLQSHGDISEKKNKIKSLKEEVQELKNIIIKMVVDSTNERK